MEHEDGESGESWTSKVACHKPIICSYVIDLLIDGDDDFNQLKTFSGYDCVEALIFSLVKDSELIYEKYFKIYLQ